MCWVREAVVKTRILYFGDEEEARNLYSFFLRAKGYEVFHFATAESCSLITGEKCTCPSGHLCADIVFADMDIRGMSGLGLIRHQLEMGCNSPPQNKVLIAPDLTADERQEVDFLGCRYLKKPFTPKELFAWVTECEKNIVVERKLVPKERLLGLPLNS